MEALSTGSAVNAAGMADVRIARVHAVLRDRLARFFLAHGRPDQLLRLDAVLAAYGDDVLALDADLRAKYGDGVLLERPRCGGCGGCEFVRFVPKSSEELAAERLRAEYMRTRELRAQQTPQQRAAQADILLALQRPPTAHVEEPRAAIYDVADAQFA